MTERVKKTLVLTSLVFAVSLCLALLSRAQSQRDALSRWRPLPLPAVLPGFAPPPEFPGQVFPAVPIREGPCRPGPPRPAPAGPGR